MRNTTRRTARAALVALTATCAMAFSASSASAAQWAELGSPPWYSNASVQGTLSIQMGTYIPGLNPPVSCPVNVPLASGFVANDPTWSVARLTATANSTCQNGRSFGITLTSTSSGTTALVTGEPGVTYSHNAPYANPSTYVQRTITVPFVNGTGATKSKLAFNNTPIADTMNGTRPAITATGNLEITSATGGTYTLAP